MVPEHLRVEAKANGGIYRMNVIPGGEATNIVRSSGTMKCWHRRFGYRDKAAISKMHQENMVTGLEMMAEANFDQVLCECCIQGKLVSKSFPISTSRSEKPIDLMHTDLCCPMQIKSFGGNRYLLTLVDGYSHSTTVNRLKSVSSC